MAYVVMAYIVMTGDDSLHRLKHTYGNKIRVSRHAWLDTGKSKRVAKDTSKHMFKHGSHLDESAQPLGSTTRSGTTSGSNYIGHTYIGHTYIGHYYIGHNYIGHDYVGHNYIGP